MVYKDTLLVCEDTLLVCEDTNQGEKMFLMVCGDTDQGWRKYFYWSVRTQTKDGENISIGLWGHKPRIRIIIILVCEETNQGI
ncbi:hypothetical protein MM236_12340 [Belliella sp. DSM 107340]|uniref:Uncharacterized protein n=1 Tax=Belliella calami TaxID=2923436 RepID=A0ABS9UQS0_9BACT|nr:hypothetical protein [Belliella calami]MCH7398784.1 hypothetical protein [Belliella calami]